MTLIKGEKTYIQKMERGHVDLMQLWGRHKDPLFYCYNVPYMSKREKDYWYKVKTPLFSKKCFAVFNYDRQLVGYISLRNIKFFRKTSELGIVFDPNKLNKGYGSDSLKIFLIYYFEVLKMKALYLKVAVFNERAQRCYKKVGFRPRRIVMDEFEDQSLPVFRDDYFLPYRDFFRLENKKIKCKYIDMVITRDMFYKQYSIKASY